MLIYVCLCILALSRIPRYDLGRQTPHFLCGSVTTVVLGEAANFLAIVARITGRRKLLWWPDCHLLLLLCWWSAVVLLLLCWWSAVALLLLWAIAPELWHRAARLSRGWGVDHAVLWGSTARTASGGS
jgi:hypothetical protein